jgi:hypothetical protein
VRGHIMYFSRRPIVAGEELTVDYKYSEELRPIVCRCGAPTCRGTMKSAPPPRPEKSVRDGGDERLRGRREPAARSGLLVPALDVLPGQAGPSSSASVSRRGRASCLSFLSLRPALDAAAPSESDPSPSSVSCCHHILLFVLTVDPGYRDYARLFPPVTSLREGRSLFFWRRLRGAEQSRVIVQRDSMTTSG